MVYHAPAPSSILELIPLTRVIGAGRSLSKIQLRMDTAPSFGSNCGTGFGPDLPAPGTRDTIWETPGEGVQFLGHTSATTTPAEATL